MTIPQIKSFDTHKCLSYIGTDLVVGYINALYLPDNIKAYLADNAFIEDNPGYYINYPELFLSNHDNNITVKKLCVAGFLYYKSTIILDRILDKEIPFSENFPLVNICQEETVKILASIYNSGSKFWALWNKRKFEYLAAYKTDSKTHNIKSYVDFEKHADRKAAFGKIAIDALFSASMIKTQREYEDLLIAHKYFYCAFQILDDIKDVSADLKTGQFNIAVWTLKNKVTSNTITEEALSSPEIIAKYIHLGNVSDELIDQALDYCSKAELIADKYMLDYWSIEIKKLWNTCIVQQLNIKAYIEMSRSSISKSEAPLNNKDVNIAIKQAYKYISSKQQPEGEWLDSCNNAGLSDIWSTAFISYFLTDHSEFTSLISLSTEFLRKNTDCGVGGYNRNWIYDNDTSFFCLLALRADNSTKSSLNDILKTQNNDGGFSTYSNQESLLSSLSNIKNYELSASGWRQSHSCVSSVALLLMAELHSFDSEFLNLLEYVTSKLRNNESLAYWWIDDIYSLYFLNKANLIIKDIELETLLVRKIEIKIRDLNFSQQPNIFNISLLVIIITTNELLLSKYAGIVESLQNVILESQLTDGSWTASNSMCIPALEETSSKGSENWPMNSRGVHIRADEFSGLFTTAVAISALKIMSYNA